ncbi:unnamed protein product [Cunninghamella echinulata]
MILFNSFLIFVISLIDITLCVDIQKYLTINQPQHHQTATFDYDLVLDYHLVKQLNHQDINQAIDIKFQWMKINDANQQQQPLQLDVHQKGTQRKVGWDLDQYTSQWKTPSCPFFVRYPPHQYQFHLIFQSRNMTKDNNNQQIQEDEPDQPDIPDNENDNDEDSTNNDNNDNNNNMKKRDEIEDENEENKDEKAVVEDKKNKIEIKPFMMIIPLDFNMVNITGLHCDHAYAQARKNHSDHHQHSEKSKHKADNPTNHLTNITTTAAVNHTS